jgi:beta-mannosidase
MARVSAAELPCEYCLNVPYRFSDRQYIRKEQSDFGWDWSPAFAPQGIWQPAFVVQISPEQPPEVYVKNSLIDIYRQGQVNNLPPDQTMPWIVNISVDYLGSRPLVGSMLVEVLDANHHPFTNQSISDVNVTSTTIQASMEMLKPPELWWPAGRGEQPLYWIKVHILSPHGTVLASISKRTGFRTIVLNQMPITQKQLDKNIAPGANWHFEINGEEIFCKGSNLVPLGVFWPNVTEDQTKALFESAVAGVSLS